MPNIAAIINPGNLYLFMFSPFASVIYENYREWDRPPLQLLKKTRLHIKGAYNYAA